MNITPKLTQALKIRKPNWCNEEKTRLIELTNKLGHKFKEIAKFFPNRSINSIKNQLYDLPLSVPYKIWTEEEDKLLIECFSQSGHKNIYFNFKLFQNRTFEELMYRWKKLKNLYQIWNKKELKLLRSLYCFAMFILKQCGL